MNSPEDFSRVLSAWVGDDGQSSGFQALASDLWRGSEDCKLLLSEAGEVLACSDLSGDWAQLKDLITLGVNLVEMIHEDEVEDWRKALQLPERVLEMRMRTNLNPTSWMWLRATLRRHQREGGQGVGYFLSLRDLSAIKTAQQQLLYQTTHDELTKLPNRAYLLSTLSERLQQMPEGNACAVLFVDLDRFKIINDSLGHSTGDAVLQQASLRLEGCLEEHDVLARFGGDEFVIGLSVVDSMAQAQQQAEEVAKKILREMSAGFVVGIDTLHVTASVGIGLYPDDSVTAEGLIQAADIAMYFVKSRGKNGFARHSAAMDNELFVQTRLEQELRRALADKTIQVHYQPQASLQDGHIFGVEALARWKHPRLGEVEPAVFFELAQTSGIAVAIDEYVQSRALADAAEWQSQGLEVAVSVNISPAQIKQESFVEDFQQRLEDANVDPAMVKVELVETALLEGADDILQNLQGIKAMGVELAIDDFGTGYSSLSYLQQFPIDWLKIDKTFLAEIKEGNNAVLVDAILAMGKGLGMKLIAEGVENAVQLNYLLENGCDAIQGFLISPAVAREQLPTLVAETKFSDLLADKQSHSDLAI
jgi:diguanylate cyclase (GGDEF)-like protein